MKSRSLLWGVALMLLGTSMSATSYHIADDVGPLADDNPATQWLNPLGTSAVVVICESEGAQDKINPSIIRVEDPLGDPLVPDVILDLSLKLRGLGGLCYASSFHDPVKKDGVFEKKNKPRFNEKDLNNTTATMWSFVQPECVDLEANENFLGLTVLDVVVLDQNDPDPTLQQPAIGGPVLTALCPGGLVGPVLGSFFIRVGNNAHAVLGNWIDGTADYFYYPEALAWWIGGGGGGNDNGLPASGHVTFFVDDPLTAGTYDCEQDVTPPFGATNVPSDSGMVFIDNMGPTGSVAPDECA